jgi:hypothetical protein
LIGISVCKDFKTTNKCIHSPILGQARFAQFATAHEIGHQLGVDCEQRNKITNASEALVCSLNEGFVMEKQGIMHTV